MTLTKRLLKIMCALGVVFLATACGCSSDMPECIEIEPVDDPLQLPYRFEVYASQSFITNKGGPSTGDLVPVEIDSGGTLGCYLIGHNWTPDAELTSLLLYRRVAFAAALTHLNIKTEFISSHRARDFDHDGRPEVAIAYTTDDTLWLEIRDFDGDSAIAYRRMLATGSDRNDDDCWDGRGFICALHDFTGDGFAEIIASCDVGYDLYPRLLFCVDWHNDTLLWQHEISGIVGLNNVEIAVLQRGEPVNVIVQVSSKGNSAVAADMNDQHSYLLVFDSQGNLRWHKETGDQFHGGEIAVFDSDDDGIPEILSAQAFDLDTTTTFLHPARVDSLLLYDADGNTLDSIWLGAKSMVNDLQKVDLDGDGIDEIAASREDGSIMLYDHHLKPLKELQLYTKAQVWGVEDYLARGDRQILLHSYDRKLWLLDQDCEPLAQMPVVANRERSTCFQRPGVAGFELVLSVDGGSKVSLVSFGTTSWALIFYREPWLAFALAFVPMSLLLILLIIWIGTWRRKNLLQAEAQTRDTAYRAHKSLIAGIGHRLRNSMSLAVLNTQTLRARYGDKFDHKATRLLEQIEGSLQSTSENIAALSIYEKIHQEKRQDRIDVVAVANDAKEAYRPLWEQLKAEVGILGGEGCIVCANRQHIYLLFDTLVGNGVEALAETADPLIRIEIIRAGNNVEINYIDNGPGIAPEVAERLGKEIVTTKPTTGFGIGVLSTFEVVKAYAGKIEYRNRETTGVAVSISLPGVA